MRALVVVLSGLVLGLLLGVSGTVHAAGEEPRGVWR